MGTSETISIVTESKENFVSDTTEIMETDASQCAGVTVALSKDLEPLEDIETSREQMLNLLQSPEWLEQYESITIVRQFVLFNVAETQWVVYENLDDIIEVLRVGVDSLRSALSRNALLCICDIFRNLPDKDKLVSTNLSSLINTLLVKGANEKRFIAQAGEEAIGAIVTCAPSIPVLSALMELSNTKSTKIGAMVAKYALMCLNGIVLQQKLKALVSDTDTLIILLRGFLELESGRSVPAKKPALAAINLLASALEKKSFESLVGEHFTQVEISKIFSATHLHPKPKEVRSVSLKQMMERKRENMMMQNENSQDKNGFI